MIETIENIFCINIIMNVDNSNQIYKLYKNIVYSLYLGVLFQ